MSTPLFTTKAKIPGGWARLMQVCEDLRTLNTDGYMPGCTLLSWVVGTPFTRISKGIVCSPFTANAIAAAFDPDYTATRGQSKDDPLKPQFDGGKPLPFGGFYHLHNGDQPVPSIVNYGLGEAIKPEELRRGDYVGLDWCVPQPPPPDKHYGGHSVFCWDVHIDPVTKKVDCFQMLGSNGTINPPGGWGVTIYGCGGAPWLQGGSGPHNGGAGKGTVQRIGGPVFADSPQTLANGVWLVLPGITKDKMDKSFLAKNPRLAFANTPVSTWGVSILEIHCARLFSDTPPPEPYCQGDGSPGTPWSTTIDGSAPAAPPPAPAAAATPPAAAGPGNPPGHMDVPSTPVPKAQAADPAAVKAVPPKPAAQDPAKPLSGQLNVELALKTFFVNGWIKNDPGDSTNINDAASQKALKEFQGKFGLDVDGIAGQHTNAMILKQLPACMMQALAVGVLGMLQKAGIIKADPGPPAPKHNAAIEAAVKEFQKLVGLLLSGLPDADTQDKLREKLSASAPSTSKPGLNPVVGAVYWLGNGVPPGGSATLRLDSNDLKIGQEFKISIKDVANKGQELDAGILKVSGKSSEAAISVPASIPLGGKISARVTADIGNGQKVDISTPATIEVRNAAAVGAVSAGLEVFFNYKGWIGPKIGPNKKNPTKEEIHAAWAKNKTWTYVGYRVPGKTAWFLRGRGMVDLDGAPNSYHPDKNKAPVHVSEYPYHDMMTLDRPLDSLDDGPSGMQMDSTGKKLYIQGPNDPAPGFLVMATPLKNGEIKEHWNPLRYSDSRVIPYLAVSEQIMGQANMPSTVDNFGGWETVGKGHTGNYGDYVTAINLGASRYGPPPKGYGYTQEPSYPPDYLDMIEINGKKYPIAHGLIGDTGNQPHFGECSYAFSRALHALNGPEYADILWMIHPGSGAGPNTIPDPAAIKSKGQDLFNAWGGQAQLETVLSKDELKSNGK